mmetsp:Transcript_52836/g.93234  ORF Transcript_52836/g.93234 Transcript_52836/m.93234 type:complete len:84 (+) Transcript_52836:304-555(+)
MLTSQSLQCDLIQRIMERICVRPMKWHPAMLENYRLGFHGFQMLKPPILEQAARVASSWAQAQWGTLVDHVCSSGNLIDSNSK